MEHSQLQGVALPYLVRAQSSVASSLPAEEHLRLSLKNAAV